MNRILLISAIIIFSSFIVTNFLNKKYSFVKLTSFLLFYYALIVLFSFLAVKFFKKNKYNKLIGSVIGFIISIILWFVFGYYAQKDLKK